MKGDIRDLVTHINQVNADLSGVKTYFDNRFDEVYTDIEEIKGGLIYINQKINLLLTHHGIPIPPYVK